MTSHIFDFARPSSLSLFGTAVKKSLIPSNLSLFRAVVTNYYPYLQRPWRNLWNTLYRNRGRAWQRSRPRRGWTFRPRSVRGDRRRSRRPKDGRVRQILDIVRVPHSEVKNIATVKKSWNVLYWWKMCLIPVKRTSLFGSGRNNKPYRLSNSWIERNGNRQDWRIWKWKTLPSESSIEQKTILMIFQTKRHFFEAIILSRNLSVGQALGFLLLRL